MIRLAVASTRPGGLGRPKIAGKAAMVAILAVVGAATQYLIHRDEKAANDLGRPRWRVRYRRGLEVVEMRAYEKGVLIMRDGVVCEKLVSR